MKPSRNMDLPFRKNDKGQWQRYRSIDRIQSFNISNTKGQSNLDISNANLALWLLRLFKRHRSVVGRYTVLLHDHATYSPYDHACRTFRIITQWIPLTRAVPSDTGKNGQYHPSRTQKSNLDKSLLTTYCCNSTASVPKSTCCAL
jgi:hypothetical protein